MDWLDLLAVQGTLKSLLQNHSSKASILQCSAFFIVQLSHPYMTTGKTIALTRQTFVCKVMSLLFNMLSRLVIAFLPRSRRLLICIHTYTYIDISDHFLSQFIIRHRVSFHTLNPVVYLYYVVVCVSSSRTPNLSLSPPPFSFSATKFISYVCESVSGL